MQNKGLRKPKFNLQKINEDSVIIEGKGFQIKSTTRASVVHEVSKSMQEQDSIDIKN